MVHVIVRITFSLVYSWEGDDQQELAQIKLNRKMASGRT